MHIRSVSYILGEDYQILSIADEFVELQHTSGAPFFPAEVWGKEIWAHIQQNNLSKTFKALFVKSRRRPLSLPFRLDSSKQFSLWQVEAEASGPNLLVSFHQLAQQARPRLAEGEQFHKPGSPMDYCGWCNRVAPAGASHTWLNAEQAEYMEGLRFVSPRSVSVKLCDACTAGLIHSHEPRYFEHLALDPSIVPTISSTMHRQLAASTGP